MRPLERQVNVQNIRNNSDTLHATCYIKSGAETVILLHGGPGFPNDLSEVAEILHQEYQVITFHQRGTKQSPCASKNYSMEAYISDIETIANHYKLQSFHLWGHSWGGLYAQIYAEKNLSRLTSLFLCCPGSGTNTEWVQTEKEVMELNKSRCTLWEWFVMGINNVLGILGSDDAYKRLFKQVMRNYNSGFKVLTDDAVDFQNLRAEPINKTRPAIIAYHRLPSLSQTSIPITLVYGDQDIYKTSKTFVMDRYPNSEVHIIEHCGHIPWLHNPDKYIQILENHYRMRSR